MRDAPSWLLAAALAIGVALNLLVGRDVPLLTAGLFAYAGALLWASYWRPGDAALLKALRTLARATVFPFRAWVLLPLGALCFAFALGLVLEHLGL